MLALKKYFVITICLYLIMPLHGRDAKRFFPQEELITIGTFYYPEHWPESQWDRDFKNMADMGFEYVHMAEFAWAFMEPSEGQFDFAWLDRAVELAGKHGLKVMLCTPTAATPVWMGIKYPEIYLVDANYRRMEHGTRQMSSLSSPVYQRLSYRIIAEMAKRYGNNPNVWGWQLDNEPEAKADYSPAAQEGFRRWLENRYKTIDALNRAWGTAFWSIVYSDFDQIRIHNTTTVGWWGNNPHALLDFKRFSADTQADFLDQQAEILREHISQRQFITTNYAGVHNHADPRRTENLDFPAFTSYPNSGTPNLGEQGFRRGDPDNLMQNNDYYRPIAGVTGVLEIQPGQVLWGSVNPLLQPGVVRMWLWHNFAAGCRLASSYRYRQILYGVEQYVSGMKLTDGITSSQGGMEYEQFIREIKELRKRYKPDSEMPRELAARRTAILWSHDNLWDHQRQSQSQQWDLWSHVLKYYRILKSMGAPVDYISEEDDFTAYPFLIVPAYQAVDEALVKMWNDYASQGGHLLITCRTGCKTRNGHFWEGPWAQPVTGLIGADITGYDMLLPNGSGEVTMEEKTYSWNNWADLLERHDDTQVLTTYSNQFYFGKAAVVARRQGSGSVTYIGVDTDDAQLERRVLQNIFQQRNVRTENFPLGVYVYWRDGFWIAVNYSSNSYMLKIPDSATILFGRRNLAPAGVTVWTQ